MSRPPKISGQLTLVQVLKEERNGKKQCLAKCTCGSTKTFFLDDYISGKVINCGVRHKLINLGPNETIFSRVRLS